MMVFLSEDDVSTLHKEKISESYFAAGFILEENRYRCVDEGKPGRSGNETRNLIAKE